MGDTLLSGDPAPVRCPKIPVESQEHPALPVDLEVSMVSHYRQCVDDARHATSAACQESMQAVWSALRDGRSGGRFGTLSHVNSESSVPLRRAMCWWGPYRDASKVVVGFYGQNADGQRHNTCYHAVGHGETFGSIAAFYGIAATSLIESNGPHVQPYPKVHTCIFIPLPVTHGAVAE
jgi:hypothetical protein